MGKVVLTDDERALLDKLRELSDADAEGAYNAYNPDLCAAIGAEKFEQTYGLLQGLKRRKLVEGQGRGKWEAGYWISDKGREALDG